MHEKSNIAKSKSFAYFVKGKSNESAYSAALNRVNNYPSHQNWLWLYSGNESGGLGCTHLLNAIDNELLYLHPKLNIKRLPAHSFSVEFENASKVSRVNSLLSSYCRYDCLLIDDMQYWMYYRKENRTYSDHLFSVLEPFKMMSKLVVFTANSEWNNLPETKTSSLLSGIEEVKVTQPDVSLKSKLVKYFSVRQGHNFNDEIVSFICLRNHGNIRELEGDINTIILYAKLDKWEITLDSIKTFYSQFNSS